MAFRPIVYAEPATGAVLYGFELPPEDGTTSWVDLCAACVGLPERLKRVVEGRPAIFSYVKRLAGYQGADRVILEGARPSYAAEVAAHVIHREALCAALAADHPLAQAADLGNEAFIFPQAAETFGFGSHLERLAGAGGFSIKIVHDVGDFLTALSMVAAGYGVVREPESMRGLDFSKVIFRPLADVAGTVELAVAFRSAEPSASVRAFIDAAIALGRRRELDASSRRHQPHPPHGEGRIRPHPFRP